MQARNTHRQKFPSFEENIAGWKSTGDTIELASQALLANGDNGAVRAVFVAYHQLNKLLKYIKVFSFMSNPSLCFILDEGLETFLGIRDLEIYILLIYMVTRLQNYHTYRLLALFQRVTPKFSFIYDI